MFILIVAGSFKCQYLQSKYKAMDAYSPQKSYYFGEISRQNDECELTKQANHSILAQIYNKLRDNHIQVINKLDDTVRLEQTQRKLCEIIDKKVKQITIQVTDKLETIIEKFFKGKQKPQQSIPQQKSPLNHIQKTECHGTSSPFALDMQQDIYPENSQMINLDESELEPIHQFIETTVCQQISLKNEDNANQELPQASNILQLFMNTFQEMNLEMTECEKLFEFPKMEHLNFHNYIDNRRNILFLAKLENNEEIGAFTHLQFNPQPNYIPRENPKSFLCNITKQIFAFASRINKTHSYDEDYLIFGNWEIKVRQNKDLLETSWGTNGDCFRLKRYGKAERLNISPQEFFGKGADTRVLKMKRYIIFAFK